MNSKNVSAPSNPASWLRTSESTPPDGLYVAIRRVDSSLVVGMCGYGNYEIYDEEIDEDINAFGWSVIETEDGDQIERPCEVIAYLPENYDLNSLGDVRAALDQKAKP